jgi:hypothetical protein
MASSITHTQVRSNPSPSVYRVVDTVTASVVIDDAVFIYVVSNSAYDHVATVNDMQTFPDTRAQAVTDNKAYYRQNTVTKDMTDITTAQEFAGMLVSRMTSLATDYDSVVNAFVGTTTATLP